MTSRAFRHLAVLIGVAYSASTLAASPSFSDGQADTIAGKLTIEKDIKQPDRVFLDGKLLFRADLDHSAWFIGSVYPRNSAAQLILLGFDTGDNSCRYLYRILEFRADKHWSKTSDFGNCQTFKDLDLPPSLREHSVKSEGREGEWRLGFPSDREGGPTTWYKYRAGKIFKGSVEVKGPDQP